MHHTLWGGGKGARTNTVHTRPYQQRHAYTTRPARKPCQYLAFSQKTREYEFGLAQAHTKTGSARQNDDGEQRGGHRVSLSCGSFWNPSSILGTQTRNLAGTVLRTCMYTGRDCMSDSASYAHTYVLQRKTNSAARAPTSLKPEGIDAATNRSYRLLWSESSQTYESSGTVPGEGARKKGG